MKWTPLEFAKEAIGGLVAIMLTSFGWIVMGIALGLFELI